MAPKKTVMVGGIIVFIAANILFLSLSAKSRPLPHFAEGFFIAMTGPLQEGVSSAVKSVKRFWYSYFYLVSCALENERLKKALALAKEERHRYREIALSNQRLRSLLDFKKKNEHPVVAAEVISKDPSPWFKSIVVDKGENEGVRKGMPVINHEGVVGVVVRTSSRYAKVLLMLDQNSAIDGLVQRTRARGIVRGTSSHECILDYVLKRHDVQAGDVVLTSGLDAIFPKGIAIGGIAAVTENGSDIFQDVRLVPYVDFENLEEVLIVVKSPTEVFFP